MLTIFLGPSGSGRSTLMKTLVTRFDWRMIRKYTTRPQRVDDDKITVTHTMFLDMEKAGKFYVSKPPIFGHEYAESKDDLNRALESGLSERWAMDSMLEFQPYYQNLSANRILVINTNLELTRENLRKTNRLDRIVHLEQEYFKCTRLAEKIENGACPNWLVLRNSGEEIFELASQVNEWIEENTQGLNRK